MSWIFYGISAIAIIASLLMVSRRNPVHALLYLVVTLLAFAILFWLLGAAFAAMLEIIIYAGAIMVLVVFVIMMLNQGDAVIDQENQWLSASSWCGPALLTTLLLVLLLLLMIAHVGSGSPLTTVNIVSAHDVGVSLFGPYVIAVELASFLLLAGLVGAFHISRTLLHRQEEQQDDR